MAFEHPFMVYLADVDAAGIVYFARSFDFCHRAFESWMDRVGLNFGALVETAPVALPVVHAEADYLQPLRLAEHLTVHMSISRVGRGSVTFDYRIVGADGRDRVRVKMVHAAIDRVRFAPTDLPTDFVAAVREHGLIALDT